MYIWKSVLGGGRMDLRWSRDRPWQRGPAFKNQPFLVFLYIELEYLRIVPPPAAVHH